MSHRHVLGLAAALFVLAAPYAAQAQDFPARSVKIIVPFGAGGPADVYARVLAQHLGETLKQPFVVENRPGAGSIIGTDAVAKSDPDGYTLLLMSNTHTVNETLTVLGESPLVDTTSSQVTGNVDRRQMEELPVQGRNWMELSKLIKGITANDVGNTPGVSRDDDFQLNLDGQQITQTAA